MHNFLLYKVILVLFFGGAIFIAGADFAKAEILNPDGAGFYSAWGNNGGGIGTFDRVDDYVAPDDDSTYNTTSTAGNQQSYSLKNSVHTTGTISNIKVRARVKAGISAGNIQLFLRSATTDYSSTNNAVTTSWTDYFYQWNTKGGLSWSISDLNSLEAGIKLESGADEHRVTQLYIEVMYETEISTAKYHVIQKIAPISPGTVISDQFNFFIADDLDEVKSAYIEIKGVAIPFNPLTLKVSVDDTAMDPASSPRVKTYIINATGRIMPFKLIYDTTDYFKTFVSGGGNYSRYLNFKIENNPGSNVYILNAKLIITYSWVKPPVVVGNYRASGTLVSSTFDTGSASGAAYNSILWKGTLNSGRVKFQLAASNCQNGATNSPTCTAGIWGTTGSDFYGEAGGSCSVANWYESSLPNEVIEIRTCRSQFNNKHYFRYKIMLCSSNDCATSGNNTPQIDDVIINFSP